MPLTNTNTNTIPAAVKSIPVSTLQAILNRASALGYTLPSQPVQDSMDVFISALKSTGLWSKIALFYVYSYNSTSLQNFSRINWVNPNVGLTLPLGGLTYTLSGWLGNGVNGYLRTGVTLNAAFSPLYQQNSGMLGITVYQQSIGDVSLISSESQTFNVFQNTSTSNLVRINSNNNASYSPDFSGTGLKALIRDSSTGIRTSSKDVFSSGTETSTSMATSSHCALKFSTVGFGTAGVSNLIVGAPFTNAEINIFRDLYNNFLTSNGLTAFA